MRGHIRGGDSSFSPRDVAGLALWLDATDRATLFQDSSLTTLVTADGQPVGGWADKSGNARHATQSIATKRPTFAVAGANGRPVVDADGVDDRLVGSGWTIAQPYTAFVVGRYDSYTTNTGLVDGTSSPGRMLLYVTGSPPKFALNAGLILASSIDPDGAMHMHSVVANAASSAYRLDGTQAATGSAGTDGMAGISLMSAFFGTSYNVTIAEVVAFSRLLTDGQVRRIESYLRRKWGTA